MATKVNAKPALVPTKDETIAKCIKAVSGNTLDGTRKQSVLAGLFVTFAMDWCQDMGTIPSNMRYHITSVHGIKALQQG